MFVDVNKITGSSKTKNYVEVWVFDADSTSNNILRGMIKCISEVIKKYIKRSRNS